MKFLVISDLHAKNDILDKMDAQFKEADAVLFAGDFAECFKPETGADALHNLCLKHDTIFSVLGNCDSPDFVEILEEKDVSVQKSLVFHDGLAFAGSGGATIFTGKTEFEREEDDILSDFDIVLNACNESGDKSLWNKVILISHNPPKNTICDAVNPELHVGSQKFADFIFDKKSSFAQVTHHHVHNMFSSIRPVSVSAEGIVIYSANLMKVLEVTTPMHDFCTNLSFPDIFPPFARRFKCPPAFCHSITCITIFLLFIHIILIEICFNK